MSAKSKFGRQSYIYDIYRSGIQRTPTEKKMFDNAKKKKKLQKVARKKNR